MPNHRQNPLSRRQQHALPHIAAASAAAAVLYHLRVAHEQNLGRSA